MWRTLLLLCAVLHVQSFAPKIIGGNNASINNYPYQVAIHVSGKMQCGGSLISQTWVLTAAHCVYGMTPNVVQVRVGSTYCSKDGTLINDIAQVIWPWQYSSSTYNYDVALIKLTKPIPITATTRPITLASPTTSVASGTNAIVLGWGLLSESGPMSPNLQALKVPIVDQNKCQKIFGTIGWAVTENMLCAGELTSSKDTCAGDSGGPLVYNNIQIGIVSWGYECAKPNYPGVYTRVSAVRDWIKMTAGV
ncbi:PREDICTED: trypsin-1-like [Eufriesea mexicana]|uniref:trypsin-1-like n=1 Tax=Eufriesea mexicana TaxID=516756 RepID=UPI00083BB017|nr:PREDICTED: trypsin-1-like [Eufriesea mexicana]